MKPAVDTVVEVFIERRMEYLPRLQRIAETIANSTGTEVSSATTETLLNACDCSRASGKALVRFAVESDEVTAEVLSSELAVPLCSLVSNP